MAPSGDDYIAYKADQPPKDFDRWYEQWLHHRPPNLAIERNDAWRVKHNLMPEYARETPITQSQQKYIRYLLRLPFKGPMPRCKAKRRRFVAACEERGDYSHSKKGHLCEACRCRKTAGHGTKGDFYGIGANTGHWGCGLCDAHEKIKNHCRSRSLELAAFDMWTLMNNGDTNMVLDGYRENVSIEAQNASLRLDIRKDLEVTASVLRDLTETLLPTGVVDALVSLTEAIKQSQFVEPEQGDQIKKLLRSKILERTRLTEYVMGSLEPLSSKSELELKLKAASTLSRLKLNEFTLDSASYVHFDELAKRYEMHLRIIRQGLNMLREELAKHKEGEEDPVQRVNDWMTREHARIWEAVKTGAKR